MAPSRLLCSISVAARLLLLLAKWRSMAGWVLKRLLQASGAAPTSGGIGMLSLASLFFAAMENARASTGIFDPADLRILGTEDGVISFRNSSDFINAQFGIVELTVDGRTTFIDTPYDEWVVRDGLVNRVPLSASQITQHQIESINVHNIAALGQGPTVGGPSGSGDFHHHRLRS